MAGHHKGGQDGSHITLVGSDILLKVRVEVEHQEPVDDQRNSYEIN